jgi:DNA-binding NarL/FixJ family response regulator
MRRSLVDMIEGAALAEVIGQVATSAEALSHPQLSQADLILLDLRLPDATGWDCARRILQLLPQAKILVFTASDGEHTETMARHIGCLGLVSKMASPESMRGSICNALEGHPLGQTVNSRQQKILHGLAASRSHPEIASRRRAAKG